MLGYMCCFHHSRVLQVCGVLRMLQGGRRKRKAFGMKWFLFS